MQRFVRAYTEAIAIYKNNRDAATKVTSKYTGIKDPAILSATVNFYAPKLARVALSDHRRRPLCPGSDRGARAESQKCCAGIFYGTALCKAVGRQRVHPGIVSEGIIWLAGRAELKARAEIKRITRVIAMIVGTA